MKGTICALLGQTMDMLNIICRSSVKHLIVIALILLGSMPANVWGQELTRKESIHMEDDILHYINKYRAKKGLDALEMNNTITDAAMVHSKRMARKAIPMGHDGFDERMHKLMSEIKGVNAAAENVAFGATSAREVVDLWIHSPGHRKNIEGNYNITGIAIASAADGSLYFTQIFLHKR
ncbi:MAG: CAP domain-containing protein [Taibaiella sp.]|nr:CAP domain-containing protein [Taibaiella sp.]